jgi:hypothetical protein
MPAVTAQQLLKTLRDREVGLGVIAAAAIIEAAVPSDPGARMAFYVVLAEYLLAALDGVPMQVEELTSAGVEPDRPGLRAS